MDEKELIKRVKNSLKAKKPKAEILAGFQKRGYKLAYAEKLITKIKRPKRIAAVFLISLILFFSLTFSTYTLFLNHQKHQISNPLSGFTFANYTSSNVQNIDIQLPISNLSINPLQYNKIEITPKFISFLLNEVGAWQLHKNSLTLVDPIINFKIDNEEFYSEIKTEIKTYKGLSKFADLQFNTDKQNLIEAIISDNPKEIFKQSITSGNTQIEIKANKAELFAKGYLKLYNSLK